MAKYTELQTRKLISSYGGVGSIIETIEGALLIKDFDKWRYFIQIEKDEIVVQENENINDERLLKRLKFHFPELTQIVKVPANYSTFYNTSLPKLKEHIIDAEYFPKWMYCNKCSSFKHINDWYKGWGNVFHSKKRDEINDSFTPPKCYKCYQEAKKTKGKKSYHTLEQVRFILIASNGNIRDLHWDQWTNSSSNKDSQKIIFNGKCCDKQDLKYLREDKVDFSGIRIQCKNPECKTKGKPVSLKGLLGQKFPDSDGNGENKIFFKPVIRTSNSVYYPLIMNSLYLPTAEIKKEIKEKIKTLSCDAGLPFEKIQEIISEKYETKVSISEIDEVVHPKEQDFIKEVDYRLKEYNYLTADGISNDDALVFEQESSESLADFGIKRLLKINRLKLTSVQTGYSRQAPIDKDLFVESSIDDFIEIKKEEKVKAKYTSSSGRETKLLPGIESFGEGIFIDFDLENSSWYNKHSKNKDFKKRIEKLSDHAKNFEYRSSEEKEKMFSNLEYLAKFTFTHTFSHILIKELEFLTGYSASSISERLYINEKDMQGVLIYTIAGSEGSFGGLVSQANSERFIKILKSALARAKDCASDPICYHSEGQGVGGLNFAACYSCSLLPETSCEEFNSYLDRALLIDERYGFYKDLTPK